MASRLPRRTPSAVGVDARAIESFLDALTGVELHSVMVLRHGVVVAEGWWAPYRADEIQLGYSLSKSFTSAALGFALTEGLFGLDDLVAGVLDHSGDLDPAYRRLTIRDIARMTTGHHVDPLGERWPRMDGEPGCTWTYNNWATWMLASAIQRASGMRLTQWLEPRLFEPLDIEDWAWSTVDGLECGYSGLHLATESWAKFGHLLLRRGELWDRQVIDEAYLYDATSVQADTATDPDGSPREVGPDWMQGYGYQFWRSQHGYRADGALGQFVCVLPEHDAVLVTTAATDDMQAILTAAWTHLLPGFGPDARDAARIAGSDVPSPEDAALAARLVALTLPPLSTRAPDQAATFRASGPGTDPFASLSQLAVSRADRTWELTCWLPEGPCTVLAGDGAWVTGDLPGAWGDPMPIGTSAGWASEDVFEVEIRSLQTPHGVRLVCNLATGTFSSHWLAEPCVPEFRQLALLPGQRHRG